MKIRHGFVSNSSSSSFCMLGVEVDNDYRAVALRNAVPDIDDDRLQACLDDYDLAAEDIVCAAREKGEIQIVYYPENVDKPDRGVLLGISSESLFMNPYFEDMTIKEIKSLLVDQIRKTVAPNGEFPVEAKVHSEDCLY